MLLISRSGYTILDILADVGGLQGILISGIALLLNICNFNFLDNYLVSKLFKLTNNAKKSETTSIDPSKTNSVKEYCVKQLLPSKLVCCRRTSRQRALDQAMGRLAKEVDIVEMIRSRRFLHLALERLLDKQTIQELKALLASSSVICW